LFFCRLEWSRLRNYIDVPLTLPFTDWKPLSHAYIYGREIAGGGRRRWVWQWQLCCWYFHRFKSYRSLPRADEEENFSVLTLPILSVEWKKRGPALTALLYLIKVFIGFPCTGTGAIISCSKRKGNNILVENLCGGDKPGTVI
jgi:hypothetical protein